MLHELKYFYQDIKRMVGRQKFRILYVCFSRDFWGIGLYRLERILFSLFGGAYAYIRIIFIPLFNIIQAYSNLDIHYHAQIKGGLLVLHPSVGVVISGFSIIGSNLTLTGGNIIGSKAKSKIVILSS